MLKQWNWRIGLENLKKKHALTDGGLDNKMYQAAMKKEIIEYLAWVKK